MRITFQSHIRFARKVQKYGDAFSKSSSIYDLGFLCDRKRGYYENDNFDSASADFNKLPSGSKTITIFRMCIVYISQTQFWIALLC